MNLIVITAIIAVCGAAKLDRTYLPPPSAKTAGGSPGSLQTPFSDNSFNQGLGGLPKGSYQNEFQGVVVDAALAGTRASGPEESGLGAPRISYGSTNSKVGDAAFRESLNAGFRQVPGNTQPGFDSQGTVDGQTAGSQISQDFQRGPQVSGGFESKSERPQAAFDRASNTVRFESEVGPESYNYAYETDNGISAEENGIAINGVQAQGGFSYKGDDGQVYSVTYTADEGGYQPRGDHLPTPPPIPDEILKSLEQNAKEEAAGLTDDGSYDAQKYNEGSDYSESDSIIRGQTRPRPTASRKPESDATASGTFINQNNQPFGARPNAGLSNQGPAAFAPNSQNNGFGQSATASASFGPSQPSQGSENLNGPFGSQNEYLPPVSGFSQNRPTQNAGQGAQKPVESRPQFGQNFNTDNEDSEKLNFQPLAQNTNQPQRRPIGSQSGTTSFGKPSLDGQTSPSNDNSVFNSASNGLFSAPASGANKLGERVQAQVPSQVSGNGFASEKEYLPPTKQATSASITQGFNQQASGRFPSSSPNGQNFGRPQGSFPRPSSNMPTGPKPAFGSQPTQSNGFQPRPQNQFNQQANQFAQSGNGLSSGQAQFGSTEAPRSETQDVKAPVSNFGAASFNLQSATKQPDIELTTPLESSGSSNDNADVSVNEPAQPLASQPLQTQFGANSNGSPSAPKRPTPTSASAFASFGTQSSSRPGSRFPTAAPSAFPAQSFQGQYNQGAIESNKPSQPAQNSFSQNQPIDAQYSPSTQRPFGQNQQPQGPDSSYYYNQPSRPFNTPSQGSRFPAPASNQFNRVTQGPSVSSQSNAFSNNRQQNIPARPFPSQNGQLQGSTKYPSPPTLAPVAPTSPTQSNQYQGNTFSAPFNGVTQASASPFPSEPPTPSTQPQPAGQFGSRPSFNQNRPSFSEPNKPVFSQQTPSIPQAFPSKPVNQFGRQPGFVQNQAQSFNQKPSDSQDQPEPGKDVPTQQYDGEIYEYNKPAETLPAPSEKDTPAPSPVQFGQRLPSGSQQSKPQFGQAQIPEAGQEPEQLDAQKPTQGSRPQFGVNPASPQFGQNIRPTQPSFGQNNFAVAQNQPAQNRPQFGNSQSFAPDSNQFSQASISQNAQFGSQPQFGAQPSRPVQGSQFSNEQNSQESRPSSDKKPQFGAQSFDNAQPSQPSFPQNSNAQEQQPSSPSRPQFGAQNRKPSQCCRAPQSGQSSIQPARVGQDASRPQGFSAQAQAQFGGQSSSFPGVQGFKPDQPSSLSFAGKGEVFGAPDRRPPSFDDKTGYHY